MDLKVKNFLISFSLTFCVFSYINGDTLWLNTGSIIVCSELKTTTNDIYDLVISAGDTISGKNMLFCENDSIKIDCIIAKHDANGYFRKYGTGFAKRISTGRIAFYEGIKAETHRYTSLGDDEIYDHTISKFKIKLYSLDNGDLHTIDGDINQMLENYVCSYEPSCVVLKRSSHYLSGGYIISSAGLIVTGIGFFNVFNRKMYPFIGGVGLVVSGGAMMAVGKKLKRRSIQIFNASDSLP
jgi:hypothetical protein